SRALSSYDKLGVAVGRHVVERTHGAAAPIRRERYVDAPGQVIPAPTIRQPAHTSRQFRERDGRNRDVTLQGREPVHHAWLRQRSKDLRDHVRVENDHSKSTARATSSRTGI